ncbi:hypothetical protein A2U01_0044933, partial [Trifolium medium]|nr:hypothetical protein [Trifolium medium]
MKRTLLKYVDFLEDVLITDPKDPLKKRKIFVKRIIDMELILSEPSSKDGRISLRWRKLRNAYNKSVSSRPPKLVPVVPSPAPRPKASNPG